MNEIRSTRLPRLRVSRWLTAASAALVVGGMAKLALRAPAARAEGDSAAGAHGALPMDEQKKRLDKLGLHPPSEGAPLGIDAQVWASLPPQGGELTDARAALGRELYFDVRLSRDGTVACATCHDVSKGFTDRRPASEGVGGKLGRRNSPTTLNALMLQTQFWDGRAAGLEDQARLPITNPIEMAMPDEASAVAAIKDDKRYQEMFKAAYGRAVNFDDLARALAAFQRTLVFLDAPFDRFAAGDVSAISDDAKQGFALFQGKGRCVSCHAFNSANPLGTNNKFHNIGVSARHQDFEQLASQALKELEQAGNTTEVKDKLALQTDMAELGRFVVTLNRNDIGAFRTSQLRNVGITAPYMHDGSLATLWDVIDHYNKGGEANPYLDGGIEPLNLSESEVDQLVAFLFALTDVRFDSQNNEELKRQDGLRKNKRPFRDDKLATRQVFPFETRLDAAKK